MKSKKVFTDHVFFCNFCRVSHTVFSCNPKEAKSEILSFGWKVKKNKWKCRLCNNFDEIYR